MHRNGSTADPGLPTAPLSGCSHSVFGVWGWSTCRGDSVLGRAGLGGADAGAREGVRGAGGGGPGARGAGVHGGSGTDWKSLNHSPGHFKDPPQRVKGGLASGGRGGGTHTHDGDARVPNAGIRNMMQRDTTNDLPLPRLVPPIEHHGIPTAPHQPSHHKLMEIDEEK